MALTLPYPNMNFVPLDVLTAAEQNQLVANIQYIANQFPVGASNINWTTTLPAIFLCNEKGFLTAASDTAIYGDEITIPTTGIYYVHVFCATYATGSGGVLFVYINKNGSNALFTNSVTANSARCSGSAISRMSLSAGDKIKGGFYGTSALGSLNGTSLMLFVARVS